MDGAAARLIELASGANYAPRLVGAPQNRLHVEKKR
jgi:hypothetical protein